MGLPLGCLRSLLRRVPCPALSCWLNDTSTLVNGSSFAQLASCCLWLHKQVNGLPHAIYRAASFGTTIARLLGFLVWRSQYFSYGMVPVSCLAPVSLADCLTWEWSPRAWQCTYRRDIGFSIHLQDGRRVRRSCGTMPVAGVC